MPRISVDIYSNLKHARSLKVKKYLYEGVQSYKNIQNVNCYDFKSLIKKFKSLIKNFNFNKSYYVKLNSLPRDMVYLYILSKCNVELSGS